MTVRKTSSIAATKGSRAKPAAPKKAAQPGTVRVAAIQMASGPNVGANLSEAERLIELAVKGGAKLVALPEYFAIMGMKDTDKVAVREVEGKGPIQNFLSRMAKRHGIWLVGGSVPLVASTPDKVRNSCLVYDDKGRQVARYDKIHLFGLDLATSITAKRKPSSPAPRSWSSTVPSAASACRSATTCVSPSCTGR